MIYDVVHEKSLFYYGRPYHVLIDTLMKPHRTAIAELIPERSAVLDVGCGTGELSLLLRRTKGCTVVGVDVSARMLDFARHRNPFPDVEFLRRDASSLGSFGDRHFDYAVLCQVLHELPRDKAMAAIAEAMRVVDQVALLDYHSPLPNNPFGLVPRLLEATIGLDHHPQFESFVAGGGLIGLVEEAGFSASVRRKLLVEGGGNDLVVLSASPEGTTLATN